VSVGEAEGVQVQAKKSRQNARAAANDLDLYERCAADWWNEDSAFSAALHDLNRLRLREITGKIGGDFRGLVVDFGCGGGLIANPLARTGARVVGFDLSLGSLRAGAANARAQAIQPGFARADVCHAPIADGCADLVICADILEHVPAWRAVLGECARVAKPGAWMYVDTINRTRRARLLAVGLAEGLRFIPPGTHDHRMFVRPDELAEAGRACGWRLDHVMGRSLRLWATLSERRLRLAPGRGIWGSYGAWMQRV